MRALKDHVPQGEMSEMSAENAEMLAELTEAGVELTADIKEAAKTLGSEKLRRGTVDPLLPQEKRKGNVAKLGPFRVDQETAEMMNRAVEVARELTAEDDGDLSSDARALRLLASDFLANHAADMVRGTAA